LVLFAHFEELESRRAQMREEISEDEDGWGWGWHGAREVKDEVRGLRALMEIN
jgi:anti-sigma regulatory factor (Ser/Thr protein kinase)